MAISHIKLLPSLLFFFFFFHLNLLLADPTPSFSFTNFDKDPNFDSTLSLYGDAKVVGTNGSSSSSSSPYIQLSSSGGRVVYKKPIKLLQGSRNLASFSTYFSFMFPADGGLAFVVVPGGFNASGFALDGKRAHGSRVVAVEYGALKSDGDLNVNHDVGGFVSVKVGNFSSADTVLRSGNRLDSWVDYEASSKRLEIRLGQFGERKPGDPILSYPVDLSRMWNDDDDQQVLIGLTTSSNGNYSSRSCFLYSWSFQLRLVPHSMHSHPLDPNGFDPKLMKPVVLEVSENKRGGGDCAVRVIAALVLGVGCGALGAFMGMNLCTMFGKRRRLSEECSSSSSSGVVHPVDFEYEKVKVVVVDKNEVFEDGKQ